MASARPSLIVGDACLIDFGEAYEISAPTSDLGIPRVYCPPEYLIDGKVGISCDIWALGCTLFEIRTGRNLFDTFDDDVDEVLWKIAMLFGKYPEPWWSETWETCREAFEDEPGADGRVIEVRKPVTDAEASHPVVVFERPEPRTLQDTIGLGLIYEDRHGLGGIQSNISQEESNLFADLLGKLLRYSPQERLSARESLGHGWFRWQGS